MCWTRLGCYSAYTTTTREGRTVAEDARAAHDQPPGLPDGSRSIPGWVWDWDSGAARWRYVPRASITRTRTDMRVIEPVIQPRDTSESMTWQPGAREPGAWTEGYTITGTVLDPRFADRYPADELCHLMTYEPGQWRVSLRGRALGWLMTAWRGIEACAAAMGGLP